MRAYVYEPRQKRRASLASELEGVDIKPHFVDEDFFGEGREQLAQQVESSDAILLGEGENTQSLIRAVRRAGLDSPLIVLRDFRNARDTSAALDQGADDVIVQPIRGAELLSRINSIIRRAHGHAAESVVVGEMVAYFDGRDPMVSGSNIKLSKREHTIFLHLALNSNKVVSKNAIYDAVYGASLDQPFDKVIDVYICKLRKKIAAAAKSGFQYIETVHGRGYRLGAPEGYDIAQDGEQPPYQNVYAKAQ
ncbi:response regulator transcription factor [Aestuariivita sp.]|jgi:two-component system cell cycle response regulator CtrA|uniref:response regulator transcription factor n=1 Tax=Aestuariivita sp. TaxID=1872407 RepID=UPI00216DE070|nr:response regulator transcription factor [Aestuariivita sp.]MCE8008989.1 response regulator transcription factor [Aestuariivita sp.]